MAESGIVFRYVFNNTEYETYEEAKAEAEGTVGGGHIYKRRKNISINQIKHWDYMQNPATYEDWEYAIGDDEDMGFVAYVPPATPCLYFKLVKNTDNTKTIGDYTHISIYSDIERTTKIKDVNIGETFKLEMGEGFSFKFMNGETEAGTADARFLIDNNEKDKTAWTTVTKKVFSAYEPVYYTTKKQVHYIAIDDNTGRMPGTQRLTFAEINEASFDATSGYTSGSTVELTDINWVSSPSPANEEE